MKEYLVEVTKVTRHWIVAMDEEQAIDMAEDLEESDDSEIEEIKVVEERDFEDEDDYMEFLEEDDIDLEEEW